MSIVGEDQMDVREGFKNCNGPVGVVGEYHVIARFDLEDVPDQEFIFNDKDSSQFPLLPSQDGIWIKFKSLGVFHNSPYAWGGGRVNRGPAIAIVSAWMSVELLTKLV